MTKRVQVDTLEHQEPKKQKTDFEIVEEDDIAVEVRFAGPKEGLEVSYIDTTTRWGFGEWNLLTSEEGQRIRIPKQLSNVRLYCPGKSCRTRHTNPTYMKSQGNLRIDGKVVGRRFQHRQAKSIEFDSKCSFPAVCVLLLDGTIKWRLARADNSKWSLPSLQPASENETHEQIFHRVYGSKLDLLEE